MGAFQCPFRVVMVLNPIGLGARMSMQEIFVFQNVFRPYQFFEG